MVIMTYSLLITSPKFNIYFCLRFLLEILEALCASLFTKKTAKGEKLKLFQSLEVKLFLLAH